VKFYYIAKIFPYNLKKVVIVIDFTNPKLTHFHLQKQSHAEEIIALWFWNILYVRP